VPKVSIAGAVRRAKAEDARARKLAAKKFGQTADSLQNFAANLGVGLDNQLSATTYGFNPVTRNRILCEWAFRGSWVAGVAVDVVADDMTRAGVDLKGQLAPEDIEHLERAATTFNIWPSVADTFRWARLYGGAICMMLIDGQKSDTPLRLDTIGKGQFKGLLVLDRWQVEPSLNDLVTEMGPDLGLPKFYTVTADAPALPRMKIHHSRILRLEGTRLPYNQRMMENGWGISILERLWDRLIAFDSASTGAAQLVYKAYLRVYRIDGMREIIGAGGPGEANLIRFVDFMRKMQSIEGITLIDGKDDLAAMAQPSFAGLSDAMNSFGQQVAGALQIPLTRLFGQSPAGMSATGESDLRTYYDGIGQQQRRWLLVPVTRIYRAMAQSEGIKLPEGFSLDFRSLWSLSDNDKASIGSTDAASVTNTYNAGVISPRTALLELRQLSKISGRFTNITDEDILAASNTTGSMMAEAQQQQMLEQGEQGMDLAQQEADEPEPKAKKKKKAKDSQMKLELELAS
jgi:phage-related protein (TIGR01555 family)